MKKRGTETEAQGRAEKHTDYVAGLRGWKGGLPGLHTAAKCYAY